MDLIYVVYGLFGTGLFLLIISIFLRIKVKRKKNILNIPRGTITYSDLYKPAHPLFSQKYLLTGKPDYILNYQNSLIPVEYKSSRYINPPLHHIIQLAAYCQLLEDAKGVAVPYGWIVYPSGKFQIPFDSSLRTHLYKVLDEMRGFSNHKNKVLNHNNSRKCSNCSFHSICSDKLC